MTANAEIGAAVRAARGTQFSQGGLARRMTALGVPSMHQETISRIELGQRPLSLAEAEVLTWILGIELSDLLTGIDGAAVEAEVREAEEALARARERLESLKR